MNDTMTDVSAGKTAQELEGLKNVTTLVYALQALGFMWGITSIVGIIINYVKRDDVKGTIYESHFDWQIRTFWWGMLWFVIGFVLVFVAVGFLVLAAGFIWTIYRVVKGWLKLSEGKAVQAA